MKIALLYAFRNSEWKSCVTITKNLKDAYHSLGHDTKSFDYDHLKGELHLENLADTLKDFQADLIVFLDHRPTPKFLLEKLLKRNVNAPLLIHLYGDFSVYCNEWLEQEFLLKYFKVHFTVASTRQELFVKQFVNNPNGFISKVPFAVNTEVFNYSQTLADQFRLEHQINADDIVFIYAGRLTSQKNVSTLLKSFQSITKQHDKGFQLLLAGNPDDSGAPFFGKYEAHGTQLLKLQKYFGEKIHWLGNLSQKSLISAYSASDVFISLSAFNDEDFGMAVVEAASCGCGVILSDWGGYHDFIESLPNSTRVAMDLNSEQRYHPNAEASAQAILSAKKFSAKERDAQREQLVQHFSISSTSQALGEIVSKHKNYEIFNGFNKNFWEFANCFRSQPSSPFSDKKDSVNDRKLKAIYQEFYNAYIS